MLPELSELDAEGPIAQIYAEIRETTGVPYVSSLQRHLATRPGWLEWCWSVVGPGFHSGLVQTTMWRLARDVEVPSLPAIDPAALGCLGVDGQAAQEVAGVLECFVRVSPTNLGFSGVIRRILLDQPPAAAARAPSGWSPPAPLTPPPPMVDVEAADADLHDVLLGLGTEVDGHPFVPGLYRMLARYPAYLAHVTTVLAPARGEARGACAEFTRRIDAAIPALQGALAASEPPARDPEERRRVVAAIDRYRETSPEMVVYGRMLAGALPADHH